MSVRNFVISFEIESGSPLFHSLFENECISFRRFGFVISVDRYLHKNGMV